MKKVISLALTALMLLTFVACGNGGATDSKTGDGVASGSASQAQDDTSKKETKKFTRGSWTDDVFTSDFAQVSFKLPEGWAKADDEQMATLFEVALDAIKADGSTGAAVDNTFYDMFVQDPVTSSNISIVFEDLSASLTGMMLDEKAYYEIAKKQFDTIEGMVYTQVGEMQECEIRGNKFFYQENLMETQGMEVNQTMLLRKVGNYILVCTFTRLGEETSQDMIAMFS